MKVDSNISVIIQKVTEWIPYFDFNTFHLREEIVTHGQSDVSIGQNIPILKTSVGSSFDGKPFAFWGSIVKCDKVR